MNIFFTYIAFNQNGGPLCYQGWIPHLRRLRYDVIFHRTLLLIMVLPSHVNQQRLTSISLTLNTVIFICNWKIEAKLNFTMHISEGTADMLLSGTFAMGNSLLCMTVSRSSHLSASATGVYELHGNSEYACGTLLWLLMLQVTISFVIHVCEFCQRQLPVYFAFFQCLLLVMLLCYCRVFSTTEDCYCSLTLLPVVLLGYCYVFSTTEDCCCSLPLLPVMLLCYCYVFSTTKDCYHVQHIFHAFWLGDFGYLYIHPDVDLHPIIQQAQTCKSSSPIHLSSS